MGLSQHWLNRALKVTFPAGLEADMTEGLTKLLAAAKTAKPSSEQKEEQRRSFAYGNTNIENPQITRQMVDREAEELNRSSVRLPSSSPAQEK
jgi:hypothetical protein